jgi:exosortase O
MILLYTPRSQVALAQSSPAWQFPAEMGAQTWPMTRGEREWLAEGGIDSAERWRFHWRGHPGSMLFVTSTSWRAQHQPERCFQVYGLTIEQSYTHLVSPDFPVRLLSLSNGNDNVRLSAAYWLQTSDQTTDDYATRIWADLRPRQQCWILVTILFDETVDPRLTEAEALYTTLHSVVQNSLAGGAQP